jgi:hypothetical protein
MTLPMPELEEEAKERRDDKYGDYAISHAVRFDGMEAVLVKLQRAWPGSVSAQGKLGGTAIMQAAFNSRVEYVRTLATMGTDLSLKHERGPGGGNVFDNAQQSNFSPEEKTAVFKMLAKHGVTSRNIPRGFQSPLYFRSIYYQDNVRTQRWINRSPLILSANRLYNWSIENQIEAQVHRTLPADLSSAGYLVSHCFFDIGGGRPDNGIARLITRSILRRLQRGQSDESYRIDWYACIWQELSHSSAMQLPTAIRSTAKLAAAVWSSAARVCIIVAMAIARSFIYRSMRLFAFAMRLWRRGR